MTDITGWKTLHWYSDTKPIPHHKFTADLPLRLFSYNLETRVN